MTRTWTCQRVTAGIKCGAENPRRRLICQVCGKKRPQTRRPAHAAALDLSYEEYVARNGSELCGICGKPPKPGKKHHRDHDHSQGIPRGLLCFRCNAALRNYMTLDWLVAAAFYVQRWERTT